ncbi:hypothetical protein C8Q77DRAFT_908359 [Trametes polyzona]|nr:hypothetical protein C8Q77DRAFT_908359 [Trametes polyzona]
MSCRARVRLPRARVSQAQCGVGQRRQDEDESQSLIETDRQARINEFRGDAPSGKNYQTPSSRRSSTFVRPPARTFLLLVRVTNAQPSQSATTQVQPVQSQRPACARCSGCRTDRSLRAPQSLFQRDPQKATAVRCHRVDSGNPAEHTMAFCRNAPVWPGGRSRTRTSASPELRAVAGTERTRSTSFSLALGGRGCNLWHAQARRASPRADGPSSESLQ